METETQTKKLLNPSTWIDKYGNELYNFAFLRTNNALDAEDLLQETLLSALKNVEGYRGEISEKNWLYFILKNKIIDFYRKKAKSLQAEIPAMIEGEYDEYFDEVGHWKKEAYPQEFSVSFENSEEEDLNSLIEKCIERLNELQRIIFSLKYFDDKDSQEICKELEITSSNYWVIIHRAKLNLRKCLEKSRKKF